MAGPIVWAVFEEWEYKGKDLKRIFSTQQKAEDYVDWLADDGDRYYMGRVFYRVVPLTVDDKVRP